MSPNSETPYHLGKLVQEHPVNYLGSLFLILFPVIAGAVFLVLSANSFSDRGFLQGRLREYPTGVMIIGIFVISVGIGYVPRLRSLIRTRSVHDILNPPPEHFSKKNDLFVFPLILVALLVMTVLSVRIGVVIVVAAGIWGALNALVASLPFRGQSLLIFERGIVVPTQSGAVPVRWEDINAVWIRESGGHIGRYDGTYLKIEGFWRNAAQALVYINKMVSDRLSQEIATGYEAGEKIRFGEIEVSKQGLTFEKALIPWRQIDSIEVSSFGVSLRQGPTARRLHGVNAHDIPNLYLLLTLTSQILSPTTKSALSPQEEPAKVLVQGEERLREFKPSVRSLIFPAIWLALGMLCIALDWSTKYPSGSLRVMYLGIPMLAGALYKLSVWFQSFGVRVLTTSDSLTYRRFDRVETFQWSDFKEIRWYYVALMRMTLVQRYELTTVDGKTVILQQGLWHVELLGDYVQKQVNALLIPRAEERIKKGEMVSFGQWGVSQQGVHDRNRVLPREEVGEILVQQRVIIVRKKGQSAPWTRIPCMGTPNLGVFLAVTKQPVKYLFPAFRAS